MKKTLIAILSLFTIMSLTTFVYAADFVNASAGAKITITGGTTAGPDLEFTPSPSTLMSASTSPTDFTITAASSKTTDENGIEYGLDSSTSDVYQQVQATTGAVTVTDSATTLPGSFTTKAGVTSP